MTNGKGSKRRPTLADRDQVDRNWERTFGNRPNREMTHGGKEKKAQ